MKKRHNKKGFSVLELSIVITIIGVLIAGVFRGGSIISKANLSAAVNLTRTSVVSKMDGLVAWYETTMPSSFNNTQAYNGGLVTTWYDISNANYNPNNATTSSSNAPVYTTKAINGLPALYFNGPLNGSSNYMSYNGTALVNSDYSIFVIEQRTAQNNNLGFFLGGTTENTDQMLQIGYRYDNDLTFDQGGDDQCEFGIASYNNTAIANIHTFISSVAAGYKSYYLNGTQECNNTSTTPLSSYNGASIGSYDPGGGDAGYYIGYIAEIIIFKRAVNENEQNDIQQYLSKKWGITVATS